MSDLPDDLVEKAAKASADFAAHRWAGVAWDDLGPAMQEDYRAEARAVLDAVAADLTRQAVADGVTTTPHERRSLIAIYGYEVGYKDGVADALAPIKALADEWDEQAKSLGPCTGPDCGGCRLGAAASRLRAAIRKAEERAT